MIRTGWAYDRGRALKIVRTSLVALILALAATQVGTAATPKKPTRIKATIWPNLVITFSPKTFPRGTWEVSVKNRTPNRHQFTIAGVNWDFIPANQTASKKVKFKFKATYTATLPDCGYPGSAEVPGDSAMDAAKAACGLRPEPGPVGEVKVT